MDQFITGYRADLQSSKNLRLKLRKLYQEASNEDLAVPIEDDQLEAIGTTIKVLDAHIESLEVHLKDLEEE